MHSAAPDLRAAAARVCRRTLALLPLAAFELLALAACAAPNSSPADDGARAALNRMVDEEVVAAGIKNPQVIAAMRTTPRQEFVPPDQRENAFFDMAVPIGHGQTISPPFIVAYMTEQLDPQPGDRVLEVGTGSGYQAAVLSHLVRDVYSVEINEPLSRTAAAALARAGIKNVHTRVGDGYAGWPQAAPFDKIIVTCSPEKVPQPLVDQLRDGGRMIVPVGERFQQTLFLFKKVNGNLSRFALQPTMFVPMTGTAEQLRSVLPDGTHPTLLGGSMEKISAETGSPQGWYYLRQAKVEADPTAPDGERVITFTNDVPGRSARALQALAVDGRAVASLDVSLWVRARDVQAGATREQTARLVIAYFDESRAVGQLGVLGGWTGSFDWRQESESLAVPAEARMAIVWIGLLGASGEASFDAVSLSASPRNPSVLPARRALKPESR
jgi:protein-L-isoaspartate(D-aspartate) O-methyltransferase